MPGETHDLDEVFESVLIDHRGRQSLFKMGKLGILWELDRATGAFVAATTSVIRPWSTSTRRPGRPPTGRARFRNRARNWSSAPDFQGIRNWRASAYHRHRRALHPHPSDLRQGHLQRGGARAAPDGRLLLLRQPAVDRLAVRGPAAPPEEPEHDGHLVAVDIDTGEIRWRHSTRLRSLAAALTTAGGLVVTADGDRYLYINDVETGDVLFQTRLPSPPQGFPSPTRPAAGSTWRFPSAGEGAGGAERAVRLRPAGAGDAVMSSDGSTAGTSRSSGGEEFGHAFDCLTQSEARYLARAPDVDTIRNRIAAAQQEEMARVAREVLTTGSASRT